MVLRSMPPSMPVLVGQLPEVSSMSSPTARTLAECRKRGWHAQVVERYIPQTRTKRDLFGCIDVVAIDTVAHQVVGIQATSDSNVASRVTKIRTECKEAIGAWLDTGARMVVWGWKKRGHRWELRQVNLTKGERHDQGEGEEEAARDPGC